MDKERVAKQLLRIAKELVPTISRVAKHGKNVKCIFSQIDLINIREALQSDGRMGDPLYKKVDGYLGSKTLSQLEL